MNTSNFDKNLRRLASQTDTVIPNVVRSRIDQTLTSLPKLAPSVEHSLANSIVRPSLWSRLRLGPKLEVAAACILLVGLVGIAALRNLNPSQAPAGGGHSSDTKAALLPLLSLSDVAIVEVCCPVESKVIQLSPIDHRDDIVQLLNAFNASNPTLLQEPFTTQYVVVIQLHNGNPIRFGPSRVGGKDILITYGNKHYVSNSEGLLKMLELVARKPISASLDPGPSKSPRTRYPLADVRGFTLTEPKGESPAATETLRLAGHFKDVQWMTNLSVILKGPDGKESRAQYFPINANGNFSGELKLGTVPGIYQVQIHAPELREMSPLNVAMGLVVSFSVENRAAISGEPSVSAEKALILASRIHQPKENLLVRFNPNFEYDSKGDKTVRPTWIVQTLSPSPYVAVFVDAITGDHFRVMQSEAPSPKPEDLGFITLEKAMESGTRGMNTSGPELGRGALLPEFRLHHPTKGLILFAAWRLELVSKAEGRLQAIILVDAKTGEVVSASNPPSGQ
jgi:hypothetical protein